jgi:hypothetical protein
MFLYKKILLLFIVVTPIKFFAQTTDYTNIENWAAHKDKLDLADRIPKALPQTNKDGNVANVFFIHPTTYTESNAYKLNWNASIRDSALNKKTDETSILFQASCFNNNCNVYAPRYRQAHIQAFFSGAVEAKASLDTAYNDIKNAFEVFLKLNNGMPIIIASHSQGTVHAGKLIKEFFENKPLMQNLVAAYLIGMPVKKDYFDQCKPCLSAQQNNCFVTWRTLLTGNLEGYMKWEKPNSIYVTNPLTWKTDTALVTRKNNKGAVLLKFNKVFKNVNGAQIHNNVLWISKPKFPLSFLVKNKMTNYHVADINLFYVNIRENIKNRLQNYLANQNIK